MTFKYQSFNMIHFKSYKISSISYNEKYAHETRGHRLWIHATRPLIKSTT